MKALRIVCRNSRLSLVQANIVKTAIQSAFPKQEVQIITTATSGDLNQTTPLYQLEGRDFFSKEIDLILTQNEADIAVHSMKDLSGERLSNPFFYGAILERELPYDVVIFSPYGIEKLKTNQAVKIGTSSLRRQELIPAFLKKALPFYNKQAPQIDFQTIRGNVDTRLEKLRDNEFDGIVLAAAGLNRLLKSELNYEAIQSLLLGTKIIWLPLMEVAPAPAQGALLAETLSTNLEVVKILEKINNAELNHLLAIERDLVKDFGGGCHQKYGVISLNYKDLTFSNIVGIDPANNDVSNIHFTPKVDLTNRTILSTTAYMKDFFTYEMSNENDSIEEHIVFVSHHRAVTDQLASTLLTKRVFAAGSRTWYELAQKGIWCEGCADGFGYDFLKPLFNSPLASVAVDDICILTNKQSANQLNNNGLKAIGTYRLVPALKQELQQKLTNADTIFWTNFQQFEATKSLLQKNVMHLCPAGKTADSFKHIGIQPVTFPNIKTFLAWQKKHTT